MQQRISHLKQADKEQALQPPLLLPFSGPQKRDEPSLGLAYNLYDYLALVDWTGRSIREGKAGSIPNNLAPLLERLNLNTADWLDIIKNFNRHFISAAGSQAHLLKHAQLTQRCWCATHTALRLCNE